MKTRIVSKRAKSGARARALKTRIITHLTESIMRQGFYRLSVDDIASSFSISKKTLYAVFPGKEKLVEAIVESFMADVSSRMDALARREGSFVNQFHDVMVFVGFTARRIGKPFLSDVQRHSPHLWTRIQEFRRKHIQAVFSDLFDRGMKEGLIRKGVDKEVFLVSYLAAVDAVVNPDFLTNHSLSARDAILGILGLFFLGTLTRSAAKRISTVSVDKRFTQSGTPL